jgi:hypothetical protein
MNLDQQRVGKTRPGAMGKNNPNIGGDWNMAGLCDG